MVSCRLGKSCIEELHQHNTTASFGLGKERQVHQEMSMSHQSKKHASLSMFSYTTPHFDRLQFHWIMKLSSHGRALQHLESSVKNACETTTVIISQLRFCAKN